MDGRLHAAKRLMPLMERQVPKIAILNTLRSYTMQGNPILDGLTYSLILGETGDRQEVQVGGFLEGQKMRLDPGELVQHFIYFRGAWEPHISAWISEQLSPGSVFVDVGANVGYYTLLAAQRVGPRGRVIAFEPIYPEIVREQIALNGWQNATVCPEAVGAQGGNLVIGISDPINTGSNSAVALSRFRKQVTVPMVTLDQRLRELGVSRVDVVKADIEGFEAEMVRGARALLSRPDAPKLVFELAPHFLRAAGGSDVAMKQLVAGLGYRLFRIEETPQCRRPGYRLVPIDPGAPEPRPIDVVALKA